MSSLEQNTIKNFASLFSNQVIKYYKSTGEITNGNWNSVLKETAKEIDLFRTKLEDVQTVTSTLPFARTLLQKCTISLLKGCKPSEKVNEKDHFNNQNLLFEHFSENKTLPTFVNLIRLKGNEASHGHLDKRNNFFESCGILYFLLQTLEEFHTFILQRHELESKKFKDDDTLSFLEKILESDRIELENSKGTIFYQDKLDILPLQNLTLKVSKKEPELLKTNKLEKLNGQVSLNQKTFIPKFEGENDMSTPCMENAAGLKCEFTQCKRKHGSKDLVTGPLVRIGRKMCCRGKNCKKNQTALIMKNGKKISLCPDLHNDNLDDAKKELGKRWTLFSEGKITFEKIWE